MCLTCTRRRTFLVYSCSLILRKNLIVLSGLLCLALYLNFIQDVTFKKCVRLLYIEPRACVKNNGNFSQEVSLARGVRQGCQVSCLIFILCMEVMSSYIRQNAKIKGLNLDENGSKNIKLIQYADDATIFEDCSGNESGNKLFRRVQKSCWNKIKHNKM